MKIIHVFFNLLVFNIVVNINTQPSFIQKPKKSAERKAFILPVKKLIKSGIFQAQEN